MATPVPAPEPGSQHEVSTYNYPWATSPDVIRAHQKDAYMTGTLSTQLSSILRELLGARFAHKYSTATTHLSELLYLSVTTLLGNRTLGEEYCDLIQVEDDTLRLASLFRRLGYIISVVFSPWLLSKTVPALRRKLRLKLEKTTARARQKHSLAQSQSPAKSIPFPLSLRLQEYILTHLDSLTSLSPIYALSLAAFYFTSSYYHLSKRLFRLRYIFTRTPGPSDQRVGYEVLGVLLILQMGVQSSLYIRETFFSSTATSPTESAQSVALHSAQPVNVGGGIELPLGGDTLLLSDLDFGHSKPPSTSFERNTHTPNIDVNEAPHFQVDEDDDTVMGWIPRGQQRKCTLCLEPYRDPSVTTCGHVFCWTCVRDWVREKPECPLCRSAILGTKILPLRG